MQRLTRAAGAAAAIVLPASAYVSHKYRYLHTTEYTGNPNGFVSAAGGNVPCAMRNLESKHTSQIDDPPQRPSGVIEETLYNLSRYIVIYTVCKLYSFLQAASLALTARVLTAQLSALVHYYINDTEVIDRHKLDRFTVFSCVPLDVSAKVTCRPSPSRILQAKRAAIGDGVQPQLHDGRPIWHGCTGVTFSQSVAPSHAMGRML